MVNLRLMANKTDKSIRFKVLECTGYIYQNMFTASKVKHHPKHYFRDVFHIRSFSKELSIFNILLPKSFLGL